jgi:hypothetical protein
MSEQKKFTKISNITANMSMCSIVVVVDLKTFSGNEVEVGDASASIVLKLDSNDLAARMGLPSAIDDPTLVIKNVFPIVDGQGRLVLYTSQKFTQIIKMEKLHHPCFLSKNSERNISKLKFVRRYFP